MRFLIDVNLPDRFSLWQGDNFIHVRNIDDEWSDTKIWEYAKDKDLIIVSKDADFSNRIIHMEPPPKVIHLRVGNLKIKQFHKFMNENWVLITELISTSKLVNVYIDRIEVID